MSVIGFIFFSVVALFLLIERNRWYIFSYFSDFILNSVWLLPEVTPRSVSLLLYFNDKNQTFTGCDNPDTEYFIVAP